MKEVDGETIEAFVDEVKAEPLIPQLPAPGKIVSEQPVEKWGATRLVLSNGVNVIVKHTDFKADEILFDAQALGGTSVIPDSYANSLAVFDDMVSAAGGLGDYTNKDMQKYLQGKQASVQLKFDDYTRDLAGSTTPKDLPTLMELVYMYFTGFNMNADEFTATQKMIEGMLKNQENTPEFVFGQKLLETLYANPRKQVPTSAIVNGADRQQIIDIERQLTANAADYTFFFVGNINMDTFRPLVEQYIATLPADAAKATKAPQFNESLAIKPGDKTITYTTPMQTPPDICLRNRVRQGQLLSRQPRSRFGGRTDSVETSARHRPRRDGCRLLHLGQRQHGPSRSLPEHRDPKRLPHETGEEAGSARLHRTGIQEHGIRRHRRGAGQDY